MAENVVRFPSCEPLIKYDAGYAKEMFEAVTAACKLPESSERQKLIAALADAIPFVACPAFIVKGDGVFNG